jgi:hypothetical protein
MKYQLVTFITEMQCVYCAVRTCEICFRFIFFFKGLTNGIQIHSFCSLSYDRSVASLKASSPHNAI